MRQAIILNSISTGEAYGRTQRACQFCWATRGYLHRAGDILTEPHRMHLGSGGPQAEVSMDERESA